MAPIPRVSLAAACVVLLAAAAVGSAIPILQGGADLPRFAEADPAPTPVPAPAPAAAASDKYSPVCDMAVERGVCLFNGQKVLLPAAPTKGLVAWYTFDDAHPLDQSGFQNHGRAAVPPGPGRLGVGASAFMDGDVYLQIPTAPSLETATPRATVSFWMYLRADYDPNTELDCTTVALVGGKVAAWSVGFVPRLGLLSASARGKPVLRSFARVRPGRWYHVAVVVGKESATLFVNGAKDSTAPLPAGDDANTYPAPELYMGHMPWESSACHVPMLLDDVKVHARPLLEYEISAESFPALGAVDASFVTLGGRDLDYAAAAKSCGEQRHLCSKNELMAGAWQAAVAIGWASPDEASWSAQQDKPAQGTERKIALCCADV